MIKKLEVITIGEGQVIMAVNDYSDKETIKLLEHIIAEIKAGKVENVVDEDERLCETNLH